MNLSDLLTHSLPPSPWGDSDHIPWHEPAFSARMLKEHLSQAHDAASRRFSKVDEQVAWIQQHILQGRPARILDLACGPGLYTSRLARLGHSCVGIDYSPASIAYARAQAQADVLACQYHEADLRTADFGSGYDLVMLIYGELNVFHRDDAAHILSKAFRALADDGQLLLEPHPFAVIQRTGTKPATWYTRTHGLFADEPYLCLSEHFWYEAERAAITRYYVATLSNSVLTRYTNTFQAYSDDDYRALLTTCGFSDIAFFPSLIGVVDESQADLCVIVARKH